MQLRACGPGRLNPWMGPSLRGLLAKPLKERWCHWEPQVRDRDYRHCAGCPHQRRCDYAQLLEPGPVDPVVVGRWNAPHGLAIIPDFPVPPEAMPDGRSVALGVMLQFLDPSAGIIDEVVHHLDRCGRQFGLGGDRVRFRVSRDDQPPQRWDWLSSLLGSGRELPVESVRTCSLRITTATPITLKRDGAVVQQPDLVDWVAGSLRLVRSLLSRETSETIGLGAERVDQYKRLAAPATNGPADWKPLNYERASNRSGDRYRVPAITGRGEYHDVPMPLARLIAVAGNLGIGQNRVCGNGQVRCDVIG
ncbi:MAG: hypothetical protein EA381_19720 [Planctomycetaceae bacterium]|nr:MAG: hypothetical protein EA381_19720 [Planctomycetaceae bacterium]